MPEPPTNTLSATDVIDRYFLQHRALVLDLAAFLDRIDRAEGDVAGDVRLRSLRHAVALLLDGKPERAKRVLELFSDRSTEPIDEAPMKGAIGAWEGFAGE